MRRKCEYGFFQITHAKNLSDQKSKTSNLTRFFGICDLEKPILTFPPHSILSLLLWVKSKLSNFWYKPPVFCQNIYITSRSMGNICKCKQSFGPFRTHSFTNSCLVWSLEMKSCDSNTLGQPAIKKSHKPDECEILVRGRA